VYAQAGGGAGAPAGFDTAWTQGTTGLDGCSGVTGCLFQVLGVMVTYIFSIITLFLSKVLVILTGVLIVFARYNAFNTAPVVTMGWVIIRDLVNVFFIVILMAREWADWEWSSWWDAGAARPAGAPGNRRLVRIRTSGCVAR